MAVYKKIRGIIGSIFAFDGGDGALIKWDGTKFQIRNSADAADIRVSGADPVDPQDFLTKNYFDTNPQSGDIAIIAVPFAFGDAGTAVDSTALIPAGATVFWVKVDITVAFDANTDVEVGDSTDADRYVVAGDVKEQKVDLYEFPQVTPATNDEVRVTLAASAATAGAGTAYVAYSVPKT